MKRPPLAVLIDAKRNLCFLSFAIADDDVLLISSPLPTRHLREVSREHPGHRIGERCLSQPVGPSHNDSLSVEKNRLMRGESAERLELDGLKEGQGSVIFLFLMNDSIAR